MPRAEDADEKKCRGCEQTKPLTDFGEKKGKPRPRCRACVAADQRKRDQAEAQRQQAHLEEPDVERLRSCLQWGTGLEREFVEALATHGSLVAAAEALGMSSLQLRRRLRDLENRAARRGWSPADDMRATVPDGFLVKGVSTFYKVDPDGTRRATGQWVKSQVEQEAKLEALAAACERLADPLRDLAPPAPAPPVSDDDLMCVYPMGDPHLGMHAWAEECGDDFDLRIACANLYDATDRLVSIAPAASTGLILQLGDMFHADSSAGTTTRGTRVDVDTRFAKVYEAGVRTMVRLIDRALEKHARVIVRNNIGNHDENASVMLGICLRAYYSRDPRVTVDTSPSPFTRYRHGRCLIATTHGNEVKHADLAEIMANDWPEDWGATVHRYFYIGHIHHEKVLERRGVVIEAFRTLAAKDAWHNRSGYRSGRDMRLDVWHAQHGLVNRHVVGVAQLGRAA